MATATGTRTRRPFTVDEQERMAEVGILKPGARVELLEGNLFESQPPAPCRFTIDEYYRLAEAGILGPDERVELLEGEIIEMCPIGSRHASRVVRLNRILHARLDATWTVRIQDPIRLHDQSEPEPDVAVVRTRSDDYESEHPGPADIVLVIEVMDSSAEDDRERKLPLYARSAIVEVWLIDLRVQVIEVYRRPVGDRYEESAAYRRGQKVSPAFLPELVIEVDALLL